MVGAGKGRGICGERNDREKEGREKEGEEHMGETMGKGEGRGRERGGADVGGDKEVVIIVSRERSRPLINARPNKRVCSN